jgi:hypothetical protein
MVVVLCTCDTRVDMLLPNGLEADLGMESLSGSQSSRIIWRRSLCGRLSGRAWDDGGCPL